MGTRESRGRRVEGRGRDKVVHAPTKELKRAEEQRRGILGWCPFMSHLLALDGAREGGWCGSHQTGAGEGRGVNKHSTNGIKEKKVLLG